MVNFRISICLVEIYQSSLAIESSTRILEIWLVFCTSGSGTKHIYTVLYNGSTAHGLHEEIDFSNPLSEINQPMRSFGFTRQACLNLTGILLRKKVKPDKR